MPIRSVRRLLSAVLLVALAGASHAAAAAPRNFDRVYSDAVHEMRGCLDVLPAGERRLVVLRSGLGPGDPVSPKAAAAKLKIKAGQVGHRAWGAVRTMRSAAAAGKCKATPAAAPALTPKPRPVAAPAVVTTPAAASTGADWTDPQMLVLAAIVAACLLGLGSEFLRLRRT